MHLMGLRMERDQMMGQGQCNWIREGVWRRTGSEKVIPSHSIFNIIQSVQMNCPIEVVQIIFYHSFIIHFMGNYLCECIDNSNTSILNRQKLSLDLSNPPSFSLKSIVLSSPVSSDGDKRSTLSTNDFEPTKLLDTGSLGNVIAVRNRNSPDEKLFAMKIIDKSKLMNNNTINCSKLEKVIANKQSQFLVSISHVFQNPKKMFITMEYCEPGDLFFYISKSRSLKEEVIRQVAAEVLEGLIVLNQEGIIHGNLKPENILVMADGHVKLSGYWHARFVKEASLSENFCSSLEYTAPETLRNQNNCDKIDVWGFGVLLYEMFHGTTPFHSGENAIKTKEAIFSGEYQINQQCSADLRDLITQLLSQTPSKRPSLQNARNHKFFKQIEWSSVIQRSNSAPLKEIVQQFNTRSHKAKFQKPKRLPYPSPDLSKLTNQ